MCIRDSRKGEQLLEHALEVVFRIACAHFGVQLGQTVQQPLLQFRHILGVNLLRIGEARKVAQKEPHGVAQTAIAVSDAFQDFLADAQIDEMCIRDRISREAAPSSFSRNTLLSTPPLAENPPRPLAARMRWQGIRMGIGLAPQA